MRTEDEHQGNSLRRGPDRAPERVPDRVQDRGQSQVRVSDRLPVRVPDRLPERNQALDQNRVPVTDGGQVRDRNQNRGQAGDRHQNRIDPRHLLQFLQYANPHSEHEHVEIRMTPG